MKKSFLYITLFLIIVYVLWYFLYPETIRCVEANSFFVWTRDYLNAKITQPGGIGFLFSDFLSQFFGWRQIGALIITLFSFVVLVGINYLFSRFKAYSNSWLSVFLTCAFILLQLKWYVVSFSLQCVIFIGAMVLISWSANILHRRIVSVLLLVLLPFLLPPAMVILFFIYSFFLEYFIHNKKGKLLLFPLVCILFSFLIPLLWNYFFSFIAPEHRYRFITQSGTSFLPIYLFYGSIIPLLIGSKYLIKNKNINNVLFAVVSCATLFLFITLPFAKEREKFAAIEHDAIMSDWAGILSLINKEDAKKDPRLQRYVLLALEEQNKLADNLFSLNPSGSDCFYFYLSNNPFCQRFNSIFYASLGAYNESIRQSFESSLQTDNGTTFQGFRQMTDCFLKIGNADVAEKYITILHKSTCHKRWCERRNKLVKALRNKSIKLPSEKNQDIFTSAYPFTQEMSLMLKSDPTNVKKEEYFLLALLLDKDLDNFLNAITTLPYLKQKKEIPLCFQQAITISASDNPDLLEKFKISPQVQQAYKNIKNQIANRLNLADKYKSTYWDYYYYKKLK